MDEAGVPEKQQYRLVGHTAKSIHARYGGGELQLLARCMASTKPTDPPGPSPSGCCSARH
jgi:hypothetical protein